MDDITLQTKNLSFSSEIQTLQVIIDSTSLGEFKTCPRKYYYRVIEGWVPRKPSWHLEFGILMHQAVESFERHKAEGMKHDDCLAATIHDAMDMTWNHDIGRPWDSGDPKLVKTRYSLLQTIEGYYNTQGGMNDRAETVILRNGKPATELSFKFVPHDYYTGKELVAITGEQIYFAGHMDRLAELSGETYVCDFKTTGSTRWGDSYFEQFSPNNQVSMYTYAGRFGIFDTEDQKAIAGVIIDAAQIRANRPPRFERRQIPRTNPEMVEWLADVKHYIHLMGVYAEENRWPMNDKACDMFFGCPYRAVCARAPGARQSVLENFYTKSPWDPSRSRGEENG